MHSFSYAIKNIRRNLWPTIAVIIVMTFTFMMTTVFVITLYGSNLFLKNLEAQAQFEVFFKNETKEEEILQRKTLLEQTGKVAKVQYISQEEAKKIFEGLSGENPQLLEGIPTNFPASLRIWARDIKDLQVLVDLFNDDPLLDETDPIIFHKDIVEKFKRTANALRMIGLGLVGLLLAISALIVLLTISLIVDTKKQEIEIMRLVGATDWFIRLPFLVQGVIYGFIAVLISALLMFPVIFLALPSMKIVFGEISFSFVKALPIFVEILVAEFVVGMFLGALGSLVAVRRK